MGWTPNDVQVLWSGEAHSNIGTTHQIAAQRDAEATLRRLEGEDATEQFDYFIADPLDPRCPVKVDLEWWLRCWNEGASKYRCRNAAFKSKQVGERRLDQVHAFTREMLLTAEREGDVPAGVYRWALAADEAAWPLLPDWARVVRASRTQVVAWFSAFVAAFQADRLADDPDCRDDSRGHAMHLRLRFLAEDLAGAMDEEIKG